MHTIDKLYKRSPFNLPQPLSHDFPISRPEHVHVSACV